MSRAVTRHRATPSGERATPVIALEDATVRYDGSAVFEGVSVEVNRGELLAVIGPSGVGKTTMLRLLGMLRKPDAGRVRVADAAVWAASNGARLRARRRIGMVFQDSNLFSASVRRNVAYGIHVRRGWRHRVRRSIDRLTGNEPDDAVLDALDVVDMVAERDRSTASLSGGEAKRIAFARALAIDPEVLLLDEPTSDLDPRNTAVLEDAMEAARDRGIGVVLATHDMHQAHRVADRVAVLVGGSVIEAGPTDRVFESPDDPRARQFIAGELVY